MFLFVDPTVDASGGVYSGYNGIHDTKIIGKGNVVFNMNSFHKSFAFVLGHTKNISISGITFKNMNEGHFIELDASNNVTISNCTFMNNASTSEKAAINIDIPDAKIGGFSFNFSTQDKTPNKNITIQNCTFKNLFRAIDSHMFSKGKYHENVTIKNCNISHCAVSPILMENWKNPVVIDNVIDDVYKGDGGALAVSDRYGVYMRGGVINPTIKNNTFKNLGQTIFAKSWENAQIPEYGITVNKIYPANIADMKNNTLVNVTNDFFAINTSATDTRGQRGEEHYYDAEKITK